MSNERETCIYDNEDNCKVYSTNTEESIRLLTNKLNHYEADVNMCDSLIRFYKRAQNRQYKRIQRIMKAINERDWDYLIALEQDTHEEYNDKI